MVLQETEGNQEQHEEGVPASDAEIAAAEITDEIITEGAAQAIEAEKGDTFEEAKPQKSDAEIKEEVEKIKKAGQDAEKASKEEHEAAVNAATASGASSVCFLCREPATSTCSNCNLVGFCGEKHEKLHRPEGFCGAFRVEQKEGVGRYIVATRNLEPLELVMYDNAAAMGPRMGSAPVCLQCLKGVDGKFRCGGCGWPMCDKKCQDGFAHKIECDILAKSTQKVEFKDMKTTHDHYRSIAPLRLLQIKEKCPEVWERLSYLMDHNIERKQDTELWETYNTYVNKFLVNCDIKNSEEEIDRAVGLLWTNAFACAKGGGQAIFPTFSLISHSCQSNCVHTVFPNKTLALQSKVAIKAGEELTINYISPMQGSLKRRMKLRDKWFFECSCARCSSPTDLDSHTSSLLCTAGCGGVVVSTAPQDPSAAWACDKCKLQISPAEVLEIENKIAQKMQELNNTNLMEFEMFLESISNVLHKYNFLVILLKRHLVGLYSTVLKELDIDDLERVKQYAMDIDTVYQIIDPGYQKDRGTVLRALCETEKVLAKKYLNDKIETEEQFSARVKECCNLYQESQKCLFLRIKKEPNPHCKFDIVQRNDAPEELTKPANDP